MLMLRLYVWAVVSHVLTVGDYPTRQFFWFFLCLPVWMTRAFIGMVIEGDEKERVILAVYALNHGWSTGEVAKPPFWVRHRFLELANLTHLEQPAPAPV